MELTISRRRDSVRLQRSMQLNKPSLVKRDNCEHRLDGIALGRSGESFMKIAFALSAAFASVLLFTSPAQARNYDCSKAGNATKAACKGKAAAPAPMAPATSPAPATATIAKPRNYDCTKIGNKFRAACRGQATAAPATAPQVTSHPAMAAQPAPTMRGGDRATHAGGPNGATAMCKDGSYSHSLHHSGTCSGHKGVATWY